MDGNGRWAKKRGLPRIAGHQEGLNAVRRAVKAANSHGVKYLTFILFAENWKRPVEEVKFLLHLMEESLRKEGEELHKKNVKVSFIGRRNELPQELRDTMKNIEILTSGNTGLNLIFAINYGGRQEITDAVQKIVESGEKILPRRLSVIIFIPDIPFPDLIIRTSGEQRISNFCCGRAPMRSFTSRRSSGLPLQKMTSESDSCLSA
jgi:undecaprenyl diphosphate synthase